MSVAVLLFQYDRLQILFVLLSVTNNLAFSKSPFLQQSRNDLESDIIGTKK